MLSFFSKFFDENGKTLKRYADIVAKINALEPQMKKLSDSKLKAKTAEFKQLLLNGKTLEEILPEAFAVVREASRRTLGLRHYDVQLIAGIAFHEGKVAEQKTGEGKTLSATLPYHGERLLGTAWRWLDGTDFWGTQCFCGRYHSW